MDKIKGIPKGLPTIGEKQIPVGEIVSQIATQLKPTMDIILTNVDGLERRVNVMEEMVNATVVDILAKRVENKLGLKYKLKQHEPDCDEEKEKK